MAPSARVAAEPPVRIIAIGASAGGVQALRRLIAELPVDLPAAVLVAQHVSPTARSVMPDILSRAGRLPCRHAREGDAIGTAAIYVAPPDRHLLVARDRLLVRRGPRENGTRPAADALFRSAAVSHGPAVIGVVLTGMLDDGTAGLVAIRRCGGIGVVQDPDDADWPDMPRNAIRGDSPMHCLPLADMASLLGRLVREPLGPSPPVPEGIRLEALIAEGEGANMDVEPIGQVSPISCPACGGVLNEIQDGGIVRFRCQIGHAFGAESLAAAQHDQLDLAFAIAARTHRERMQLFQRLERHALAHGHTRTAQRWHQQASDANAAADLIERFTGALRPPREH